MTTVKDRLWRTLIRVTAINRETGNVFIVIPGWNSLKETIVDINEFPSDDVVDVNNRYHADVNIGADYTTELKICNIRY